MSSVEPATGEHADTLTPASPQTIQRMKAASAAFMRWSIAIALVVWTALVIFGNPDTDGIPCLFRATTGYDCPGCGLQHSVHHLFHGRLGDALAANLLFPLVLPLTLWAFGSTLLPLFTRGRYRMPELRIPTFLIALLSLIIIAYWILRNM